MIQRGVKINYKISARVDTINPELLAAQTLGLLPDSLRHRIRHATASELSAKGTNAGENRTRLQMDARRGHRLFAYMMIGIPYETKAEMMHTVEFAKRLKPDYAQFSICTPYPKTELYFQMLSEGIVEEDYWQRFAENPSPDFKIRFWNRDFSELELRDIQDECHARFYRSPTYIMKQIAKVKSWSDFTAKARMGTKILTSRLTAGN